MSRLNRRTSGAPLLTVLGAWLAALVLLAPSVASAGLPYQVQWLFTQENPACEVADLLDHDGDPFFRIQMLAIVFVACLAGLIYREMRIANPLINFRTLAERNFRSCCIIIFCAFGVLYANTTSLPGLLQSLFGYDATTSGLVLSPAGVFALWR